MTPIRTSILTHITLSRGLIVAGVYPAVSGFCLAAKAAYSIGTLCIGLPVFLMLSIGIAYQIGLGSKKMKTMDHVADKLLHGHYLNYF